MADIWVFGYGSLIWRPDFAFLERSPARITGWVRRFWQGSHDHRGLPDAPGRVVTLIAQPDGFCDGVAYRIEPAVAQAVFEQLDHREKNGYALHNVVLQFTDGQESKGRVYIASTANHAFLGPAPVDEMARQISTCHGPSGANSEYLLELANALRELAAEDEHVYELESALFAHHAQR